MTSLVLLDHGPKGTPVRFSGAEAVVRADTVAEVGPALARLDELRSKGLWVAGYLAYEAGYAMEPRLAPLMPGRRNGPLMAFGAFRAPEPVGEVAGEGSLSGIAPAIDRADYDRAFNTIAAYIAAGDCYQVNLTFPMKAQLTGTPLGLYARLKARGHVGFGGYADLGMAPVVVSMSPELFVAVEGRSVRARPMKGTAPRGADAAEDAALAEALYTSEKARAENLMIVDLLRNDIGRIARVGSVSVPELFKVEAFSTVHQMSSAITGTLADPPGMARLAAALFPCGSITGAPKIRAMEIIHEVEHAPRGVYCGALGWMAPSGDAAFNVAIRTLSIIGQDVTFGVGGGIVADSTADGEWEEALWKARFTRPR